MGYRKMRFPIRTANKVEYRDGYTFDACFSDGTLFEVGVFKNGKKQWNVTELNTGLALCYGVTRIDAVKKFQDIYLSKLERLVINNDWNVYSEKTAEFQAMLKEGAK
jgi:hypothetical protein